jgi:hypothetical protein
MLQTVWWVKVLRDDPVRLVRALRFRATLRFELHEAFWLAAPLAVAALRSKVAGSRKAGELRKVRSGGKRRGGKGGGKGEAILPEVGGAFWLAMGE